MLLFQTFATQLQLHHLYPQKGLLYPRKISRGSQSHCTSCSCPHRFHHRMMFVAALTASKPALISLPPLPGMKGEMLLNHMVGTRQQRYHGKQKEQKVSDAVHIRSPTKKHHKDFMRMNYQRVLEGNIKADVDDVVNLKQAARARIDNLGHVKLHSCFVNDPDRLNRIKGRGLHCQSEWWMKSRSRKSRTKQRVRRKGFIKCSRRKLKCTNVARLVRDISQRIT